MNYINISRKSLSIMAVSATLSVCSILYCNNKPNAYEICVDNKLVAYVKEDKKDLDLVKALGEDVLKRFGTSKLKNNLTVNKVKVEENYITQEDKIKNTIIENSDLLIDAYSILADNKEVGLVADEKEGKEVLEKVKNFYAAKSGLEVKDSGIKTNISYKKEKAILSQVDSIEEAANRIEEVNSKLSKPIVIFEIKGISKSTEAVAPAVNIQWSDDMLTGQSKLIDNGKEGQKIIEKEVTLENTKITNTKVISEKITAAAKDKVVLQGRKNPILASTGPLLTPSRGAISSLFGMRWGKMHEGLDIAANMGDPIRAALDGTVVYAGWEQGYGNIIKLQHQNGLMTFYGHCSRLDVSVGQKVSKGDTIGLVGSTGNSTGPHLHFEVRLNGVAQNPVAFLN